MKIKLEDMSWPEIEEALKEPNVAILPTGATEQHGRHLPVNVDSRSATYVAEQAARKVTEEHQIRVLVLPTIYYGETSGTPPFSRAFTGNIGVSVDTYLRMIEEIVRSLVAQGFKNIIVLNGHSENSVPGAAALRKVSIDFPTPSLYAINWFNLGLDTWSNVSKGGAAGAGHSCEKETAVSLAIQPENVQLDKAVKGSRTGILPKKYIAQGPPGAVYYHSHVGGVRNSGIMGDPTMATKETGAEFLSAVVDDLAKIIVEIVKSEGVVVQEIG